MKIDKSLFEKDNLIPEDDPKPITIKQLNKPIHLGCYVQFLHAGMILTDKVIDIYEKKVEVETKFTLKSETKQMKVLISHILRVK